MGEAKSLRSAGLRALLLRTRTDRSVGLGTPSLCYLEAGALRSPHLCWAPSHCMHGSQWCVSSSKEVALARALKHHGAWPSCGWESWGEAGVEGGAGTEGRSGRSCSRRPGACASGCGWPFPEEGARCTCGQSLWARPSLRRCSGSGPGQPQEGIVDLPTSQHGARGPCLEGMWAGVQALSPSLGDSQLNLAPACPTS